MSKIKTPEIADSIAFLAEQFQGQHTTSTMHSINIVNAIDRVAHSLWDGLRANGSDNIIPDGLFAVSESLDKIADAINKNRGDA
tara:strand:+ start:1745 stop:1996 length:252 start_codon:yes stop_codon:yes gene_type:complete